MTILGVDHTAIVVADLDAAVTRFQTLYGAEVGDRETVADQHVDVAFLRWGATQLELIQPTDPDSGVGRFLARRGEGLHHVCFQVDNLDAELQRLQDAGARLIDAERRRGAHGWIAFVHPGSSDGVLVELLEPFAR